MYTTIPLKFGGKGDYYVLPYRGGRTISLLETLSLNKPVMEEDSLFRGGALLLKREACYSPSILLNRYSNLEKHHQNAYQRNDVHNQAYYDQ